MDRKMLCGACSLRNSASFIARNTYPSLMPQFQDCQHTEHR
jgi:hypothetical protein